MAINDVRSSTTVHPARSRLGFIDWLALALMIVGGINWGLVGLMNLDLVAMIFGQMTTASRIVYALVGLAALYGIVLAFRIPSASAGADARAT